MDSSMGFRKLSINLLVSATCGLTLLVPAHLRAQVAGATLSGTVTDTSGAVIPAAQVTVKNVGTGISAEVPANADGFYSVPNLLPGSYEVTATASGFATEVQSGVTLTVGAQQVLNFTLKVGQTTEKVEVTGAAPTVQLASSSISAVVGSTTVVELPLNGRSWTDLAALQPGVGALTIQPLFSNGPDRGVRGFGAELAINGARPQQNNYRLDGISLNDYGNGGPGNVLGGNLGVDAIQEFSVLTTNYSAEYGKSAGGVVNAITRSGTNQFHGTAYEFLRNDAFDAANFFENAGGSRKAAFRRNQFGASAGGPVRKDRTFVFGDYEGIRQSKGLPVLDIVPSEAARQGILCSAPSSPGACTTATVPIDPSAQKYLALYPHANAGPAGDNGDAGFDTFSSDQVVNENFATARVDNKFSEKDSMYGSFMYDKTPYTSPDGIDLVLIGQSTTRVLNTIEETHIFSPQLVNTVRAGYNRVSANVGGGVSAINPAAADLSLSAVPGRTSSQLAIGAPFTPLPAGLLGASAPKFHWNSFQGYDDAFLTRGTHSLKLGFAVERMEQNDAASPSLPGGVWTFGSLQKFYANDPHSFQAGITAIPEYFRQTLFGGYVQDDWRWRPNLTLNLGVRYEMVTVPTEARNHLTNLLNLTDATPHLGNPLFNNPTLRNFEPRVGFAWDPFNSGKTAVRGGFGIVDSLPMIYQFITSMARAAPYVARGSITAAQGLPPGSFFTGGTPLLGATSLQATTFENDPHRSYVQTWNLNVQRQITPSVTALLGYVGSHGVHLPYEVDDPDMVIPTLTSAGYLFPNPVGSGTKINPNFGATPGIFYKAVSFYDALEVGVSKRMSHGLQFQTSFTWGKSIDNSSATIQGDQFTNGVSSLDWWAPNLTRGLSDFNVGRTLVINLTWQVPRAGSLSGPAGWIVNGWELGGIFKASDGVPWTPTWGTGSDPQGIGNSDDYAFPDILSGPGCTSLVNPGNPNHYLRDGTLPGQATCFAVPTAPSQASYNANCDPTFGNPALLQCFNLRGNAGRNIIMGPGLETLDFSLFKDNYVKRISESFNIQFRAEFFNILNRANFGVPHISNAEGDVFDGTGAPISTAGQLTTTSTTPREIQFALKLIW